MSGRETRRAGGLASGAHGGLASGWQSGLTALVVIRTMLIRMTGIGATIASLVTAGALALGGVLGSDRPAPRTALVIDAATARDGRELVAPSLRDVDAAVRLPRTAAEAETNVRYFAELGDRVIVAGPLASAAAAKAGIAVERARGLPGALAAARR
jgi:hypothetical protein